MQKSERLGIKELLKKITDKVEKIVKIDINVCDEKKIRNKNMIGR